MMTDENTVDNETNIVSTNGDSENSHQPLPSLSMKIIQCIHMNCFWLEMVLETSTNSTIERNIYQVLRKHFLEQRPITWKPIKVELVVNTELTDDFFRKSIHNFSSNSIFFLYLFF